MDLSKKPSEYPRKKFDYSDLNRSIIEPMYRSHFKQPITAAGCLFYRVKSGKMEILLANYKKKEFLDDLGGKTDLEDTGIFDTISREVSEESNSLIDGSYIINAMILGKSKSFYHKSSKYLCLVIEVSEHFHSDYKVFGDYEHTEGYERTIEWYPMDRQTTSRLNPRLKENAALMMYLNNIKSIVCSKKQK